MINNFRNAKIILFCKNEKFLTTLSELLSNHGFLIYGSNSIENILHLLNDKSYDVLIINNDFSRLEIISIFKKIAKVNPDVIKIILTTKKRFKTAIELLNLGAFDYILKPFKSEELILTIRSALNVRRLAIERDMYSCVFENSAEGIYLTDVHGNYVLVNRSLANIFGYSSTKEFLEHNKNIHLHLYDSNDYTDRLNTMLYKKHTIGRDLEIFKRDGKKIWISEKICPVYDKNGHIIYHRGTIEDITQKRNIELELRKSEAMSRMHAENIEESTDLFIEIIDEICDSYKILEEMFINFVKIVVSILDEKCPWSKGHSVRVAEYSEKIGRAMNIPEDELKKLKVAGLLHDIGKIVTSESLLSKPSRYSEEELKIIRRHPVEGAQILNRLEHFKDIVPYIKYHHEWFNGNGYPEGLKGDKIPFYARILHISECYDSMITKKPYCTAHNKENAINEIKRFSGIQFDPEVTKFALEVL